MTSTDQGMTPGQPGDAAMFAPLTTDENSILRAHLTSGWYKQSAVYPVLSEPWQETGGLLDDLHDAHKAAMEARAAARAKAEPQLTGSTPAAGPEPEPEAGS
jgi:hypothetical protein